MKNSTKKLLSGVVVATSVLGAAQPVLADTVKPSTDAELEATRAVVALNESNGSAIKWNIADAKVKALPQGAVRSWLESQMALQIKNVFTEEFKVGVRAITVIQNAGDPSAVEFEEAKNTLDAKIKAVKNVESQQFLRSAFVQIQEVVYTPEYINAVRLATEAFNNPTDANIKAAEAAINALPDGVNKEYLLGQMTNNVYPKAEFTIVSAKALNAKTVEVELNKPATEDISVANFSIDNSARISDVYFVGNKAILTLANNVQTGEDYTVTFLNEEGKTTTATFKYETAAIASVELTDTKMQFGEDLNEYVVVKDKLGRDITNEVDLTFESSNTSIINANGKVQDIKGKVTVGVIATRDGEEVTSKDYIVNAQKVVLKELSGFALNAENPAQSDLFQGANLTMGAEDATMGVYGVDKKGKFVNVNDIATFKSSNSAVVSVNNEGLLQAVSEGTANVTVTADDISKTYKVVVQSESIASKFSLEETRMDLVVETPKSTSEVSKTVRSRDTENIMKSIVTVLDQYGKGLTVGSTGTTETDGTISVPVTRKNVKTGVAETVGNLKIKSNDKDGILNLDFVDGAIKVTSAKVGSTTIDVKYKADTTVDKDGKDLSRQTIRVNVLEKGTGQQKFEMAATANSIDAKDQTNGNVVSTVKLYEKDENGSLIEIPADRKVVFKEVSDVDGIEVTTDGAISFSNVDGFNKTGVVKVQAKVDDKVVATLDVNYTNSASVVSLATVAKDRITLSESDIIDNTSSSAINLGGILFGFTNAKDGTQHTLAALAIKDQFGNSSSIKVSDIKEFNAEISNLNGVTLNGAKDDMNSTVELANGKTVGTFDLVITKLVHVNGNNLTEKPVVITVTLTK